MKKLLFGLVIAVFGFTWGCKAPQKVTYAPDQLVPKEHSIMWKISENGLKKPSYLYGTIHIIPKSDFVFSERARYALDHTQRVAFEIDMKEMTNMRTQFSLMTKAFMGGGKTLKDLLPAEDYSYVRGKMEEKGLPSGMFERLKPMFLSTLFSSDDEKGGMAGSKGEFTSVEMELYKAARRRKMESAGLETADYQMAIFDSIPYQTQARMLVEGLRATETTADGKDELDKMLELYQAQDINAMQSSIAEDEGGIGNYEDLLLDRRNRNWIPVMGRLMREKPTLFAVGAGHLGGPSGVVALLRKAGYRVEAVPEEIDKP